MKAGKIERPVNQITIASNFYEMLQNIEEIGSDLELGLPMGAYVSSPTLKIKEISEILNLKENKTLTTSTG